METAIVFFAGQILDSAVTNAGRLIRTGQIQQAATSQEDFRQLVCDELGLMFECNSKLLVDVRTYDSFGSIVYELPFEDDEDEPFDQGEAAYFPGGAGEVVVVRVFYTWPVLFDLYGFNLSNITNGRRLLGSVVAFRNEPFPWENPFDEG
jgi:Flp pilus assembly protein TadG